MASIRRGDRQLGKSDPIDVEAVTRVALRAAGLSVAELPGPIWHVKLLSDHRHSVVARRTALQAKVCWCLHEIDPDPHVSSEGLHRYQLLEELLEFLDQRQGVIVEIPRDLLQAKVVHPEGVRGATEHDAGTNTLATCGFSCSRRSQH
jgi:hypothetical protein